PQIDVPEAVRAAVLGYRAPEGFSIATLPNRNKPSIINFYGVRLDIGSAPFPEGNREQKFACLASNRCRVHRTLIKISKDQTTGETQHLKESHQITSSTSVKTAKR
ncbi:unnamed protein product, partial [Scytosiphon promiscuus]